VPLQSAKCRLKNGAANYVIKEHLKRLGPAVKAALENKRVKEEKELAEEGLRESEEKYRTILESIEEGYWEVDLAGNFTFLNDAMCEIRGYTKDELMGMNNREYMDPETTKRVYQIFSKVYTTGKPEKRIEWESIRKDGTKRYVESSVALISDSKDQPIGFRGVVRDISDRKKAKEEQRLSFRILEMSNRHTALIPLLKEFVAEVKNFTGCAAAGIRILDEQGNIPYQAYEGFNHRFYESESPLSISSDQCMCINVIKGVTDPNLPFYTEAGSFYMNGTTRFLETVSEEQKGQTRNVCNEVGYESVALVPIHERAGIIGLIQVADPRENVVPLEMVKILERVTMQLGTAIQRIKSEQALSESEQRLSEAQRIAHVGNWEWGIDKDVLYWSDEIYRIFGLKPHEFKISRGHFLNMVHPDDRELVTKAANEALYENKPYSIDHRIVLTDGSEHFVHQEGSVTFDKKGKPIGMVGTFQDITERKLSEGALLESERQVRLLLDSTAEAIYGLDMDGNCTFANSACIKLLDYKSPDELIGENMHNLIHHTRPDGSPYPREECRIYQAFLKGKGSHVTDEVLWRADGTSFPAEYWSYPIYRREQIVGAVMTFLDITERRQAEDALRKQTHELGERIKELNCLYGISKILEKNIPLEDGIQQIVNIISSGWQYPEVTCARVILEDREFRTGNFRETIWKLDRNIFVYGEPIGDIAVCYLEERPERGVIQDRWRSVKNFQKSTGLFVLFVLVENKYH